MSFDSEVKAYTKIALKDAHKVVKEVVNRAMVITVDRTPVDTGKLKNSWYASFGSPITAINGRSEDASGGDSLNSAYDVTSKINQSKMGESIFYTNSLKYSADIELGKSGKAPTGMMRRSMRDAVKGFEKI
tara:strand:- start:333 stop:725 length:393 start_codon:yes stop_codon:yes gene_type:complete